MKNIIIAIALLAVSCGNNSSSKSNWTEKEEIHFYNDCKAKMEAQGETSENAHTFCECCLLELKEQYTTGKAAMENLTDKEITTIEAGCSK